MHTSTWLCSRNFWVLATRLDKVAGFTATLATLQASAETDTAAALARPRRPARGREPVALLSKLRAQGFSTRLARLGADPPPGSTGVRDRPPKAGGWAGGQGPKG